MTKHFALIITEDSFSYHRKSRSIAAEARLDGLYVVRPSRSRRPSARQSCAAGLFLTMFA